MAIFQNSSYWDRSNLEASVLLVILYGWVNYSIISHFPCNTFIHCLQIKTPYLLNNLDWYILCVFFSAGHPFPWCTAHSSCSGIRPLRTWFCSVVVFSLESPLLAVFSSWSTSLIHRYRRKQIRFIYTYNEIIIVCEFTSPPTFNEVMECLAL